MMLSTGHRGHAGVEETRARILGAARELYERHGTRGTTTREVAERAGVNEATLFRHFGSKRALIEAMREQSCGVQEFRSLLAGLSGDDVAADLRTLAYHSVDHMVARRAMMCVSLAEEAAGAEVPPELRGPSLIKNDLASFFSQRVAAGALRGDPNFLARFFMGILFSYVVGRKLWDHAVPDHATIDAIVELFLNGVKA